MRILNNTFEAKHQLLQHFSCYLTNNLQRIVITQIVLFSFFISGKSQDCLNDTIPPEIICKQNYIHRAGWCGNYEVYASEFVLSAVDNCSRVKITFDKEGKNEWADSFILGMDPNWPNGQITIYARDTSGNVSECIATYTIVYSIMSTFNYKLISCVDDDLDHDKIQLKLRTNDNKTHIANLVKNNSNSLEFQITLESNLSIQSIILEALDKPFIRDNISTFDQIETLRQIVGIGRYSSPVNFISADTDCNGEVNFLDVYTSRQYLLGNISVDSCLGKPILYFIDESGNMLGPEIPYQKNPIKSPTIAFNRIGDINRDLPNPGTPLINQVTKFGGEPLLWKALEINCVKGNRYAVDFTLNDSSSLFGMQCNFAFDPNLIELDTFYTNYTTNYPIQQIYSNDIQIAWMNTFNPKFENNYPKTTILFTATSDFTLSKAFKSAHQSISNFAIASNGAVKPIAIEFSIVSAADNASNDNPWIKISNDISGYISNIFGNIAPFQETEMSMYNIYGQSILNQKIITIDGNINQSVQLSSPGVYLVVLTLPNRKQLVQSFVVNY